MKKIFILVVLFMGVSNFASAQNVVIQSNTTTPQSVVNDNQYYINGVSILDDIGGVDVQFEHVYGKANCSYYNLEFTNYHNFTVRVVYELPGGYDGKTFGSITLRANETKVSPTTYKQKYENKSIIMIVRRL